MKTAHKAILAIGLCSILASCSSVSLTPAAEKVKAGSGAAPKGCMFRGEVYSKDIDTSGLSHNYIQNKQVMSLRNKAALMGANAVFVTGHTAHVKPQFITSQGRYVSDINKHEISGKAYSCSPEAWGRIVPFTAG